MMAQVEMGVEVKDQITGFRGITTGYTTYISGCAQWLVQPEIVGKKNERPEPQWIDEQRLEIVPRGRRIKLDNRFTPGPDMPAPIR